MKNFDQEKQELLQAIESADFMFSKTLTFIERWYLHTPCAFTNGNILNTAEQNQGSCKVLFFAMQEGLTNEQCLRCFGEHYRDVLATPNKDNHLNLRRLLVDGLNGIHFDGIPLSRIN
jgi:hypothetical protein